MMRFWLTTLSVALLVSSYAQESTPCYFDASLLPTSKKNAVYQGALVPKEDKWEATAYYSNGSPIMRGNYKDKKLKIKQGAYTLYYPDGSKKAAAFFNDNLPDGVYQEWYPNGQLSDSGLIHLQYREGLWKTWYSNGHIESFGAYKNGSPDGQWNWYHPNGKSSTIEKYMDNRLDDLTCFDTLGMETGSNCRIEKKPSPRGEYDFESFIESHLFYPEEALKKGIEGEVSFEFLINKAGRLTHINFTNKASPLLQEEVVKLLKSVNEWEPAVSHNREIDYLYSFTVPFYMPATVPE